MVLRATLSACTARNVSLAAGSQVLHRAAKPATPVVFAKKAL